MILTDPALRWAEARRPGDPLRPPGDDGLAPLLAHWGLALAPGGHGVVPLTVGGRRLLLVDPGRFAATGPACRVQADGRIADCTIGRGRVRLLADADAFRSIGFDRRKALWEVRRTPDAELPLFAHARAAELGSEPDMTLPVMPAVEHVVTDYQTLRLSLQGHPMQFLRDRLDRMGVTSCADIMATKAGAKVTAAGLVLVRQRPGKGNAIFVTLEDEGGITNVVLWARLFEAYRREVMGARLMLVEGEVQRSREGIVHLMGSRVWDRSDLLDLLGEAPSPVLPRKEENIVPVASRHPRDVRLVPKSRDFH